MKNLYQVKVVVKEVIFLLLLITTISSTKLLSQSITDFNEVLAFNSEAKSVNTEIRKLQNYYLDYNPVLIVSNNSIKKSENSDCRVADLSIENISNLYSKNVEFERIEFLKINISKSNELKALDLSALDSFSNLKYVLFQFDYNCSAEEIKSLVKNSTKKSVSVYYLVSIPE